jgi:hypothetical protein
MAKQRVSHDQADPRPPAVDDPQPPVNGGEKPAPAEATPAPNGEMPTAPGDVFDRLDSFRLRQSFDKVVVRRPLTTVGIRKPKAHEWFQTHPDYRYEGVLFKAQEEGLSEEWYFPTNETVLAALEEFSAKGVKDVCVFWWINRKKNTSIWPVVMADSDGRQNEWHASMYEMLTLHSNGQWCRIEAGDGGYNPTIADNSDYLPQNGHPCSISGTCCVLRSRRVVGRSTAWATP